MGELKKKFCDLLVWQKAHDLGYINKSKYDDVESVSDQVGKMLYRWIKSQAKR